MEKIPYDFGVLMSRNIYAAEQLLKLADELEAQAEGMTLFACENCGEAKTLQDINSSIRKYAAKNKIASEGILVSVNDRVKCPSCGGAMAYQPTASSAQFYVEEPAGQDTNKVEAAVIPDNLSKPLTSAAELARKALAKGSAYVKDLVRDVNDSPYNVDRHKGVDPETFKNAGSTSLQQDAKDLLEALHREHVVDVQRWLQENLLQKVSVPGGAVQPSTGGARSPSVNMEKLARYLA